MKEVLDWLERPKADIEAATEYIQHLLNECDTSKWWLLEEQQQLQDSVNSYESRSIQHARWTRWLGREPRQKLSKVIERQYQIELIEANLSRFLGQADAILRQLPARLERVSDTRNDMIDLQQRHERDWSGDFGVRRSSESA